MRHAVFDDSPRVTHTASEIPGDPLNIALVGTKEEVIHAMIAAKWDPADALTFRSSVRIAVDTVLRKPDDQAPVSNLYLFGRKEDLAFEKPVGNSPKQRHHVRFWQMAKTYDDRPAWIGSAAYDIGVELSRTTGQVTHHISPDVDAERDLLVADLTKAIAAQVDWLDKFHTQLEGRNGGGDPMANRWPPGHCHSASSASSEHRGPDALNSHIQASKPMVCASCAVIAAFGSAANAQPLRMIMARVRLQTPVRHFESS